MSNVKRFCKIAVVSGMVSSVVYILHVIIGGMLWEGYSHVVQPISDLTGVGAPNADLLRVFTNIYGFLAIVFAISIYIILKDTVNKTSKIGMILLIIMELTSFVGYSLFPLDAANSGMTFQNIMHIVITAIVVICTISSTFLIGIGFSKISPLKKLGIFTIVCGVVITISGGSISILMANNIPVLGLVERINIFTLQIWIFVISFNFIRNQNKYYIPNDHNF